MSNNLRLILLISILGNTIFTSKTSESMKVLNQATLSMDGNTGIDQTLEGEISDAGLFGDNNVDPNMFSNEMFSDAIFGDDNNSTDTMTADTQNNESMPANGDDNQMADDTMVANTQTNESMTANGDDTGFINEETTNSFSINNGQVVEQPAPAVVQDEQPAPALLQNEVVAPDLLQDEELAPVAKIAEEAAPVAQKAEEAAPVAQKAEEASPVSLEDEQVEVVETTTTTTTTDVLETVENPDSALKPSKQAKMTFTDAVGDEVETTDVSPFFMAEDEAYVKYISLQDQPPSFKYLGLTASAVMSNIPDKLENFVNTASPTPLTTTTGQDETLRNREFNQSCVKADEWVFCTFELLDPNPFEESSYTYLFNFTDLGNNEVFFREASEHCPMPEVKEPVPPIIKKCHWYYSRVEAIYEYYVKISQLTSNENLLKCICEGIMKLQNQPSIELLCLEDALVTTSHSLLTQEKYDNFMELYTHREGNVYDTNQKEEFSVGKVEATDLTQDQIEAYKDAVMTENNVDVNEKIIVGDVLEQSSR